jgi:hypothetical protein
MNLQKALSVLYVHGMIGLYIELILDHMNMFLFLGGFCVFCVYVLFLSNHNTQGTKTLKANEHRG